MQEFTLSNRLYILKLIQLELTGRGFLVAMLTFLVMSTLNGLRLSAMTFMPGLEPLQDHTNIKYIITL